MAGALNTAIGPTATAQSLGNALTDQRDAQTEEERKKKLRDAQATALLGPTSMALGLGGRNAAGA